MRRHRTAAALGLGAFARSEPQGVGIVAMSVARSLVGGLLAFLIVALTASGNRPAHDTVREG